MKKPLLYSLLVWLILFLLPITRPQAVLDWKSATTQQLSDLNGAWVPLDPPNQLETSVLGSYSETDALSKDTWKDLG